METIRAQMKNPVTVGIVGFLLGIFVGLVILGWWLWPVEWINATPEQLSPEWQEKYLRMTIEAYGQNGDVSKAQERYAALGPGASIILEDVSLDPGDISPEVITAFTNEVSAATVPTQDEQPRNWLTILIPLICVLLLVAAAFVVYMFMIRKKGEGGTVPEPEPTVPERKQSPATGEYSSAEEPPLAQFMASYKLGDDLFDESFSIDSVTGEFLGECGIGISEAVGVGDPKKVTAFEVWLFDKNDIQTITKVLMSTHAYNDNAVRQRLAAKGEPVLLTPTSEILLETQTLSMVARVVDLGYGESAMPAESFFDRMLLELAVWQK